MSEPAVQRWALPVVEGPIVGRRVDPTVAEKAAKAEHARGYEAGYEAGMAAGRSAMQAQITELQARVARLDSILKFLSKPLEELDSEVEQQLSLLALTVAKHIVRRELRTDPEQVIAIIRETVGRLPAAARDVRVHLNPDDAAIVRERLPAANNERAWTIVEDPSISRGGCTVRSESSQIDARLETRLNAAIAAAMGDERHPARAATSERAE